MMALVREAGEAGAAEAMDRALELALGEEGYRELDEQNLPFAAYERLFALVVAAATGAEVDDAGRFCDKNG
ncbi:MAG: hypothetical protein PHO10_03075 [Gemmiger sp.]|nr:hypothetical protein [Gemmiger sp.]